MLTIDLKQMIRRVPDFPKPGPDRVRPAL